MNDIELLHSKKVLQMVRACRKTLNRWVKAGRFPPPVLPNRWRKDQVLAAISGELWEESSQSGHKRTTTSGLTSNEKES